MKNYLINRILSMLLTLFIVVTGVFFIVRLVPGDPLASMARNLPEQIKQNFYAHYGLNKPLLSQYFSYIKELCQGNMGESLVYPGRTVIGIIKRAAPISARINLQALVFGVSSGLLLGLLAACKKGKWPDYLVMFIAVAGISVPSFVMATTLQYYFTVKFNLLPTIGYKAGIAGFKYTILPTIALSFASIAIYARYFRASVLEVLSQDYILTARAKGVSGLRMAWFHIGKNSLLPVITILGPQIAGIFIGSFVIESIFGIPGFGQVYVEAINNRDFTMILGQTILLNGLYIFSLFIVDLVYGLVDPRIKIFKKG
ncbi:ABC transporter permease [uncultured Cetobacterium sp.]|uniref:ABC transporter permease n=1 Tax=uncultured Cetobacterium sp. TaxID=527638 RepID=UPI00262188CF|nr:ABC transporter permease [uncultured Cetobacterium sp.]